MLGVIQNNPYRLLGIYSNSPTKERVANHNRLKAFLKVGKEVSFPLDLSRLLPTVIRSEEVISSADAKLTLPNDQIRYAQFWFMKASPLDDIAMNHLIAGNVNEAVSIWEKKDNASSLQNRIVCALMQDNYSTAIVCADKLYSLHSVDFANMVLGDNHTTSIDNLPNVFIDELCETIGAQKLLPYLSNKVWKQYVKDKIIKSKIATLQSAIDTAKAVKGKGSDARFAAGTKLMNDTKVSLAQLKALLSANDLQYQMIADKLGLEILQCGIDYYNASEAEDAAYKAMKLQAYALSIVVGKMAQDRCKENVDILQNIISNLPPKEVFAEDKAIKGELRKFCQLPDEICNAVTLLNNAKPHLQVIKQRLGAGNAYYLKVSTQVVGNALHNVIEEVNAVQQEETVTFGDARLPVSMFWDRNAKIAHIAQIKRTLQVAWNATKLMDTFDMETEFKANRYTVNRSILKNMCEQLGISTSILVKRPTPSKVSPSQSVSPSSTTKNSA